MTNLFRLIISLILILFVGCGGGGGGGNSTSIGNSVSGVASKGLLKNATINANALDAAGNIGSLLGTATTDANGSYSIDLGSYTGNIIIQATGGTYTDEATGITTTNSMLLRAAVTSVTGNVKAAVTPMTEIAVQKAGTLTTANIEQSNTVVSNMIGLDIIITMPANVLVTSSSTTSEKNYGLALAAVSQMVSNGTASNVADAISQISADLADNKLDITGASISTALTTFISNTSKNQTGLDSTTATVVQRIGNATTMTITEGINWTARNLGYYADVDASSTSLYGIVWSGTQFVAVGYSATWLNAILTSPDGIIWTSHILGPPGTATAANLKGIAWSGTQFVAVGYGWDGLGSSYGVIYTSPDGSTWTSRTSGTTKELHGIAWSGTQFVAVGYGYDPSGSNPGIIITSPDGITWTSRSSGTTNGLSAIVWTGTQFAATGDGIITSPDGITWTSRSMPSGAIAIVWTGTQFVAVGGGGYAGNIILTSPDGITWTSRTSGTTNGLGGLYGIAWSGTQFVAVGYDPFASNGNIQKSNSGTILTSPDGITWTNRTPGTIGNLDAITWSGTQFVAAGCDGTILTSPDGITWTNRTPVTSWALSGIAWSGTQFVAVGDLYNNITSPDGITWTSHTLGSGTVTELSAIVWTGTQFATVGTVCDPHGTPGSNCYPAILTSPDGNTWTSRTSGTTEQLTSIAWSDAQFVVVGINGTILTSPDGITWTSRTSGTPTGDNLWGIVWTGTQFVAVGFPGTILTSPDGITWTSRTSGTTEALDGIAWSGTQFVAVGNNGTILTSPDGTIWTGRTSGTIASLTAIVWTGTQFVAVGDGWDSAGSIYGAILTSPDGITWTNRSTTYGIRAIVWSGTQFVAVGDQGIILTSQ